MFKLILSKLPKKTSKSSGNQEFHAAFAPVLDSSKSSKGNPINKSLSTLYSASNLGDYHLDKLSVDAYEALPGFREVPSSERQNLFIRKLKMCCILFDFSNPNKNLKEKEIKRQTLLELLEYITSANAKFSDSIIEEAVKMVSANIFRSFSPQPRDNVLGAYDSEEDEPFGDPAWPHLQIVYEFLLRFVLSPETDAKSGKKYIDHFFVLNLLDLFDSEDPRERDYLKNILHRVYGKFMVHRPFIWTSMNNIFYTFIFETEKHNGIAELLEILGSIINGFSLPLKGEHNLFLVRALIPLHKPRCLAMYHKQLSYCVLQFVEKDCKLADNVIRGLLKYWPISSSSKELMFLEELEEVLDATQPPEFQGCMVPLFQQITRCLNSLHFQVAERALCLWNNDHIYNLIDQNCDVILPIVFPAVERNARSHWNESVHSLTVVIRKIFFGLDPELFEECLIKFQDDKYKEEAVKAKSEAMWRRLERIASKKPATNEAVLLSF